MSGALQWSGTDAADDFVFDGDSDRFDFVLGGQGDDVIADGADDGYWSDDVFMGQGGDDTLISAEGHDVLRGGKGDDTVEVRIGWYDPAEMQFPVPGVEHDQVGFDVEVRGGKGWDVLTLVDSDGSSAERDGNGWIIHTVWGGTVSVQGVEEILFL